MAVPRPAVRRPISITVLVLLAALLPVLFPVILVVGLVADLVTLNRGLRFTRVAALLGLLVVIDFLAFLVVLGLLAMELVSSEERIHARYHWITTIWTNAIMRAIALTVPLTFDTSGLEDHIRENSIVIARHRSLLDAVQPAALIGERGLHVRYTLKEELRWEPNIDLVGHSMPHRFVQRSPDNVDAELDPIRELGRHIGAGSAALIFPEGTFFTERRKEQIVQSLERRDPRHADAARAMRYVLPPRPGGTLALLEGAPDADVVILGHVGYEPFGTIPEIVRNIGVRRTVLLKAWRFERHEIPEERRDRIDWLFDQWTMLDQWIHEHHERPGSFPKPSG